MLFLFLNSDRKYRFYSSDIILKWQLYQLHSQNRQNCVDMHVFTYCLSIEKEEDDEDAWVALANLRLAAA